MPTDEELIDEILNGSQAAMEVLVKRYYKVIFSYIYRKTGDYHTSLDLTQEVFIKMMKSIKNYRHQSKFINWLMKIAVNHVKDYYKSKDYVRYNHLEYDESIIDKKDNVRDIFTLNHEHDDVKSGILSLSDEQRDTIILRFYHDMKIKDIANVMQLKESTVKSRLRQGLIKLKKILNDDVNINRSSN